MADSAGARHSEIRVSGVVQGVGFRPFVVRLAREHGISGAVWNAGGGVHIRALGAAAALDAFAGALRDLAPAAARVERVDVTGAAPFEAEGFAILRSAPSGGPAAASPDIALCGDCLREIRDPSDRRRGHALNSCSACGPRYTILRALPYDRMRTSMDTFPMCAACATEYRAESDRRFHAQTICCPDCGPQVSADVREAAALIRGGGLLLVKGIGGYHIACSPHAAGAVVALRQIKSRDAKPFAVMFRDLPAVRAVCAPSEAEAELLASPARPIVLLDLLGADPFDPGVLRGDARCGALLPYTALHHLLLDALGSMVLTSANRGGGAIITADGDARAFMAEAGIRALLTHPREIVRPAEDGVAQHALGAPQILRRGRGQVPNAISIPSARDVLALGGDLKAAWCAAHGGRAFLGPHMGDLQDAGAYERFRSGLRDFCQLVGCDPQRAVCDSHPGYFSTELARGLGLPLLRVQHHHAHIASVMAEHGLRGPVIGAAYDGTGYGADGAIWGGEFLVCEGGAFERAAHLAYVRMVGGDAVARDARQMAYAYLREPELVGVESAQVLDAALDAGVAAVRCSSMGRLFDAAAAVLGLRAVNGYEGECAIALQRAAEAARRSGVKPHPLRMELDGAALIREMWALRGEVDAGALALGFHVAVADMTARVCRRIAGARGIVDAALSGGVWQNRLLLEFTVERLRGAGLRAHWNRIVPVNDGGLALGQAWLAGFDEAPQ